MSKDPAAHALAFRVMRLCRPALQADLPLRCSAHDLWLGEDDPPLASSAPPPPDDAAHNQRTTTLLHPALHSQETHTHTSCQTSHNSFITPFPPPRILPPPGHHPIHLPPPALSPLVPSAPSFPPLTLTYRHPSSPPHTHDKCSPVEICLSMKHDCPLRLVCSAHYIDFGEHKVLPQYFKFMAANPLSVKTKARDHAGVVRTIRESTFLEACIENGSKAALFLDQVRFEPTPAWQVAQLEPEFTGKEEEEEEDGEEGAREEWGGAAVADEEDDTVTGVAWSEVRALFKPVDLIRANGGTRHFLYHLHRTPPPPAAGGGGGAGEGGGGAAKVEGGNTLGRLEILWRSTLGEPGRLQTQQILGNPIARKEVELKLVSLPTRIVLERPFLVHCRVHNNSDRPLGPLRIVIARDEPVTTTTPRAIVVSGPWTMTIISIAPNSSADFNLSMVALASGVHKISGVGVVDARDSKPYDALTPTEVYVELQ
ncbi:unnamed protein product [Closterium sp. Naga37s-1]|nr:unnamed protein product [Closterium sp. Naga37s-1]